MKLTDLQEAKYYIHPVVEWIEKHIQNRLGVRTYPEFNSIDVPEGINGAVTAITKQYGQPEHESQFSVEWRVTKPPRSATFVVIANVDDGDPEVPYINIYEL
jgi:hypothetical protein